MVIYCRSVAFRIRLALSVQRDGVLACWRDSVTQPYTLKLSILWLCSTIICESYTRIGSRNIMDNKFLSTKKEIIISLSLTPLAISGDFL